MHLTSMLLAAAATLAPAAFADPSTMSQREAIRGEVAIAPAAEAANWGIVVNERYVIAQGYSFSPIFTFGNNPAHVDALRTQLFYDVGEFCGASIYAIDVTHTIDQPFATRYFPDAQGVISLPDTNVYKMMVTLFQPQFVRSLCTLKISTLPYGGDGGGNTPPDLEDYELVGVAHYEGGFQHRIAIDLAGEKIERFWLRVPPFCEGLETLEAGTVSEDQYDAARLIDAEHGVYEVNGGAGTRASAINASFNGPSGLTCDIPVYVLKTAD